MTLNTPPSTDVKNVERPELMDFDEIIELLDYSTMGIAQRARKTQNYQGTIWLSDPVSISLIEPDSFCFGKASQFNAIPAQFVRQATFALFLDEPLKPTSESVGIVTFTSAAEQRDCYEQLATEFRLLRRAVDRIFTLTALVSKGAGLQRIINEVSRIFGMPASIIDTSLSFLAYSDGFPDFAADRAEQNQGFLPERAQLALKEEGLIDTLHDTDKVRVFTWEGPDGKQATNHFAFICIDGTPVASVSLLTQGEPLQKSRLALMPILAQILSIELQKSNSYLMNKAMRYSHLLTKLLDGSVDADSISSQFAMFGHTLKAYKHVVCVDFSREFYDVSQVQALAERFHQVIPNNVYVVRDRFIVFLSTCDTLKDEHDREGGGEALRGIVRGSDVKVGVSSLYAETPRTGAYLEEAKRAIRTGMQLHPNESVFFFSDYRMADLLDRIDGEALYSYRYPPLMKVIEEDLAHGTHLAYTLYVYLADPGHPAEVCKQLFIHKNTLYYRLDKLRDIMGEDLRSADVVTQAQMTFLILQHQGKFNRIVPHSEGTANEGA